ncbi:MAG: hypothetical protein R6X02_11120 [Enhygromyxa sp.]
MRSELYTVILSVALLFGCADFKRGEYWELDDDAVADEGGPEGEYGYARDVHSLLDAGCERCHAPGKSADNTDFLIISDDLEASYASTLEFVNLGSPADSRLLSKTAGKGRGGG